VRAPLPANEAARLAALRRYDILDSAPETVFDDLARLASFIGDTPIGTFTLIDAERQWFKSQVGLADRETERDAAFCAYTILEDVVLQVPDAMLDPRFADNRLVTGDPNIRFYAGAPVKSSDGFNIGTVCVIDRAPRAGLTVAQREALEALARQASKLLELRRTAGELAGVMRDMRALASMLPICSHCRRIRDEHSHWQSAEEALQATGAQLSHGLCPDCLLKHYPDYADVLKQP
jgi:GAF domain-containing protein